MIHAPENVVVRKGYIQVETDYGKIRGDLTKRG
jgi:hypothetical protein